MLNINSKVWEETEVKEFGEYETLDLGGHACIIRNADIYTGQSGNQSLRVQVDIDTTDKQAGFFQKQFDNDTRSEKKWANGATKYFSLKEENLGMLKAFTTAVENSNAGFKFDMDETKLTQIRSLDKLNEIKIPKVKKLDSSFVDYEEYKNHRATATAEEVFGSSIVETDSGDLPFEI